MKSINIMLMYTLLVITDSALSSQQSDLYQRNDMYQRTKKLSQYPDLYQDALSSKGIYKKSTLQLIAEKNAREAGKRCHQRAIDQGFITEEGKNKYNPTIQLGDPQKIALEAGKRCHQRAIDQGFIEEDALMEQIGNCPASFTHAINTYDEFNVTTQENATQKKNITHQIEMLMGRNGNDMLAITQRREHNLVEQLKKDKEIYDQLHAQQQQSATQPIPTSIKHTNVVKVDKKASPTSVTFQDNKHLQQKTKQRTSLKTFAAHRESTQKFSPTARTLIEHLSHAERRREKQFNAEYLQQTPHLLAKEHNTSSTHKATLKKSKTTSNLQDLYHESQESSNSHYAYHQDHTNHTHKKPALSLTIPSDEDIDFFENVSI